MNNHLAKGVHILYKLDQLKQRIDINIRVINPVIEVLILLVTWDSDVGSYHFLFHAGVNGNVVVMKQAADR